MKQENWYKLTCSWCSWWSLLSRKWAVKPRAKRGQMSGKRSIRRIVFLASPAHLPTRKKKLPATQAKPEPERPICLLLSRWNYKNFFSSDAMKSCNSGRERWSGNSCPNSVDRRGTDKPWSEHQEGIKVEKNNRELNVWVNSEYRLCEKFELCKLRCTFLKIEYAVTMQSANWINNRARNFC